VEAPTLQAAENAGAVRVAEWAPVGGEAAACVAAAFLQNCRQYRCTRSSPFGDLTTHRRFCFAFFRNLFSRRLAPEVWCAKYETAWRV